MRVRWPSGGHRRADDALRKSFLVDISDVENFETAWAVRGVEIFAAQPNVFDIVAAVSYASVNSEPLSRCFL